MRGWQAASPSACPNFGNGATKPVALYNLSEPGQMQTDANKVSMLFACLGLDASRIEGLIIRASI